MKEKDICKERGYHNWSEDFDSTTDDYYEIEFEATCGDCGATVSACGNWLDTMEDMREEEDE